MKSPHDAFTEQAGKLFPGSSVVNSDSYEQAKDRVLAMLRDHNKYKPPVERWKSACLVFYDLHTRWTDTDEPHKSWAARVLNEDMANLLKALHNAGQAQEFTSPWPDRWEPEPDPDLCPF